MDSPSDPQEPCAGGGDPAAQGEPRPMRVAMDIRAAEAGNVGVYIRELLGGFARTGLPVAWTLVGPESYRDRLPQGLAIERWIDYDKPIHSLASFLRYPSLNGIDLFHYPHYNLPLTRARRAVVNLFDLIALRPHARFGFRRKNFWLRRLRWSRASVIVSSRKTGEDLARLARLAPTRIARIPPGVGRPQPATPFAPPARLDSMAATPLRPPWLLAVGSSHQRRDFNFLIGALGLYFQRRADTPPLVWVGVRPEGRRRAPNLPAHTRQRVALAPEADEETMESLMAGARALVVPSLDESFGFAALEAMARGVPVICSRREPMMSLLGEAALYFEPTESASLWRVLDRLLDVPSVSEEIVLRGLRCAQRHAWELTARATFGLYAQFTGWPGQE